MGEETCARLLKLLVRAEGVAEKDEKWAPWIRECGVRRRPSKGGGEYVSEAGRSKRKRPRAAADQQLTSGWRRLIRWAAGSDLAVRDDIRCQLTCWGGEEGRASGGCEG